MHLMMYALFYLLNIIYGSIIDGMSYSEPNSKKCSKCHQWLPLGEFYRNKAQPDGYQNCCKRCKQGYDKAWFDRAYAQEPYRQSELKRNRDAALQRQLVKHNMTMEEYERLSSLGCAICRGETNGRGRYHFDHDHKTGQFRGLLCSLCNTALGHLKDQTSLIRKAIEYVKNKGTVHLVR